MDFFPIDELLSLLHFEEGEEELESVPEFSDSPSLSSPNCMAGFCRLHSLKKLLSMFYRNLNMTHDSIPQKRPRIKHCQVAKNPALLLSMTRMQ